MQCGRRYVVDLLNANKGRIIVSPMDKNGLWVASTEEQRTDSHVMHCLTEPGGYDTFSGPGRPLKRCNAGK